MEKKRHTSQKNLISGQCFHLHIALSSHNLIKFYTEQNIAPVKACSKTYIFPLTLWAVRHLKPSPAVIIKFYNNFLQQASARFYFL